MNNEIKTISPFKNFCVTIGNLPTSYLESMSYYEMLCWFCKYLENTINPAINSNAEALKELQEYVATYFDELNVQNEINNKLDEMVQDGTMAEIINEEIFSDLSDRVTSVENQLKLSNIHEITVNEITGDTDIIQSLISGYITWNSDSSWFKCFLYLRISKDATVKTINIPLPEGFVVTNTYTISSAGDRFEDGLFQGSIGLNVSPSGISITFDGAGTFTAKFAPYMYYNGVIES